MFFWFQIKTFYGEAIYLVGEVYALQLVFEFVECRFRKYLQKTFTIKIGFLLF